MHTPCTSHVPTVFWIFSKLLALPFPSLWKHLPQFIYCPCLHFLPCLKRSYCKGRPFIQSEGNLLKGLLKQSTDTQLRMIPGDNYCISLVHLKQGANINHGEQLSRFQLKVKQIYIFDNLRPTCTLPILNNISSSRYNKTRSTRSKTWN